MYYMEYLKIGECKNFIIEYINMNDVLGNVLRIY